MENISKTSDLNTLLINVSEKIENKNLKNFISSSLSLNNINLSNDDKLYYSYLSESNQYQFFILNNSFTALNIEVLKTKYLREFSLDTKNIDLFLTDEYFVIFKNQKIYYFQEINYDISEEDLRGYIKKKLNLNLDNILFIDNIELYELEKIYVQKIKHSDLELFSKNKNSSLIYYILYTLLLVLFSFIYVYYSQNEQKELALINKQIQAKKQNEYQVKFKYIPSLLHIIKLSKKIKNYNLLLKQALFKNNNLQILISSKKKENIYAFLDEYEKGLLKNTIIYNKEKKEYECNANIKINRQ